MPFDILDNNALGAFSAPTYEQYHNEADRQNAQVNRAMDIGNANEYQKAVQTKTQEAQQKAQEAQQAAQQAEQLKQDAIRAAVPQFSQEALLRANGQLTQLKQGYAQAMAAGDADTANRIAQSADALRKHYENIGMSGLFGADEYNADQAATVLQAQQGQAMQSFLDMASPKEVYIQKQREYLQRGYNENEAKTFAARDADEYQAKWERQALGAAYNYGVGDNALNNNGIRILSGLSAYNPNMAAIGFKSYGLPVDEYNHLWGVRKANVAADIANKQMGLKHGYDIDSMLTRGSINRELTALQGANNIQAQNNATDNAIRQMTAQFGLNQQQQENLWNFARENPELFATLYSKSATSKSGNNGDSKKNNDEIKTRIKNLQDYVKRAEAQGKTDTEEYKTASRQLKNLQLYGDENGQIIDAFNGDWAHDEEIINRLWDNMRDDGYGEQQIAEKVYEYALSCGVSQEMAEAYGNSVLADGLKVNFSGDNTKTPEQPQYIASTINYENQNKDKAPERIEQGKRNVYNFNPSANPNFYGNNYYPLYNIQR